MIKTIAAMIATAAITAGATTATAALAAQGDEQGPKWTYTACEYEDSNNCFWNSGTRGNHSGHSFYAVNAGPSTCILYWNDRYAKKNNYCFIR